VLRQLKAYDRVTGNQEIHKLEERVRDLERLLGRKTMEIEILKKVLAKSQLKKTLLSASLMKCNLRRFQLPRPLVFLTAI